MAYVCLGALCAFLILLDEMRRPQPMWIMNIVWPVSALFGTAWIVWQYLAFGRSKTGASMQAGNWAAHARGHGKPFPVEVANATLHCGSGCTLGDICAEAFIVTFPVIAVALGWHRIFAQRLFAGWMLDYVLAFGFGVIFQYFTIAPMRQLSLSQGLLAAIKADALSLTAWQMGMYGFMALAHFVLFRSLLHVELRPESLTSWFMMQIAMLCGFLSSYPVNWWLLKSGIKEPM